jgi:hypothetical protein
MIDAKSRDQVKYGRISNGVAGAGFLAGIPAIIIWGVFGHSQALLSGILAGIAAGCIILWIVLANKIDNLDRGRYRNAMCPECQQVFDRYIHGEEEADVD